MAKLILEHQDFTLEIKGNKVAENYSNARKALGEDALYSSYSFSQPYKILRLEDLEWSSLLCDDSVVSNMDISHAKPFFFDYTDYSITVMFHEKPKGEKDAWVRTRLQNIQRTCDYHPEGGFLTSFINYQNDIGNSDLTIDYVINGEKRSFTFGYQVLSTKLDYHTHWKKIVNDIEEEYRMLAFDFLRQTYHSFAKNPEGESTDLIWWNLFKAKHEDFLKACRLILDRPRQKTRPMIEYLRSDQLKYLTPQLENKLTEHRYEVNVKYRNEQYTLSNDTPENRFLKYAITDIAVTFQNLSSVILTRFTGKDGLSNSVCAEIHEQRQLLKRLKNHPFFRTVGKFSGLNQESLILQRAAGYSTVAQIYILLKASYSLLNGMFTLETKDIAKLYEIWCFIEIRGIVRDLFSKSDKNLKIEDLNRQELNGKFNRSLVTGNNSKVLFKCNGVELAELYYNAKTGKMESGCIPSSVAPSGVEQKPDIILQLTRCFLDSPIKLTYLFDAKYRLNTNNDHDNGFDQPPDDAINQMHRYRDAIYYQEATTSQLRKEVIGGYILFPGKGQSSSLEAQQFYKSIKDINIGAFPLRPCDEENRQYLVNFIKKLIEEDTQQHIDKAIPQKGMTQHYDLPGMLRDVTVFGTTHGQDQLEQITLHKLYILPKRAAELQDIDDENVKQKRWLFIEMRPDNASSYSQIFEVENYEGFMFPDDLKARGYQSQFRHGQFGYYVWKVK
ncbi:MAG: restriction endonuclease-like protein [Lentisphaeria bacterium]|nr:restriction endonuclease-like protein [Lentisphaeria bacterium]